MLRLIGRRLLLMVPTLILASILIFALAEVLPGWRQATVGAALGAELARG